ncbi:hypothetical protein GCM10023321_02720 [Pseudonocardia eucalypti]|uniref:PIN domain-containing protein n=1 Tax=Pseudonocardia eucalypti TaxID=648755 RepID=A0ABP9PF70_9PSEU|nr:hypothetical protein [Pseudonocardia eucalypti]
MNLVLDAGALIALERRDRKVAGLIELARRADAGLVTSAPVLGQVWRHGGRQVALARLMPLLDVRAAGIAEARAAGRLLGRSDTADVVDALLALVAVPGDQILTGDPDDLRLLAESREIPVTVVAV